MRGFTVNAILRTIDSLVNAEDIGAPNLENN